MQQSTLEALSNELSHLGEIVKTQGLSGGDINDVHRIDFNSGKSYCLKLNSANSFPGMFEAEHKGLNLLRQNSSFIIPEVVQTGTIQNQSYLLMNYIPRGLKGKTFSEQFGRSLAEMHHVSSSTFGLDHDNYIGSLVQINQHFDSWNDFFRESRLVPQLKMARDLGKVSAETVRLFDRLFSKLHNLFPEESAALIHGDLWNGNQMTAMDGTPVLIDPAVAFSHREMDLAMMKLFGGFDHHIFEVYHEVFPLENEWEKRTELCNLYPLMVHVNLFGGHYSHQVQGILEAYVR